MAETSNELTNRRRLLVVRNPIAGRRKDHVYIEVVTRLRDAGCEVDERSTERRGDAEVFAREVDPARYDALVVAGGDGTINEALNGLAQHPDGPGCVAFGIIPLGTTNVLAIEIGLENTASGIAAALMSGPVRPVRAGRVNDRRFIQMVGAGFDAHVVAGVTRGLKRYFGKLAYALVSAREMLMFRFPGYQVHAGGEVFNAASVIVANGRHYAGTYVAAPDASLGSGSFEVCIFEKGGPWHTARYGLNMLVGRLHRSSGYRIVRTDKVRIEGPPGDPVQGDGDILSSLPADITLDESPVRLIFPA